jgi:diguanylate cyclase (GGDEF)-like protein
MISKRIGIRILVVVGVAASLSLIAFGKLLKRRLRDSDYACRYGGEELCVILTNTAMRGAYKAAEDIRQAVMAMDTDGVSVTVSIGVATLEQLSTASPESLLNLKKSVDRSILLLICCSYRKSV